MAEIKEAIKAIEAGNYIMFRDKPFIREKNAICYGRMDDKYILFMLILSEKDGEVLGEMKKIPDNVLVQILSTDTSKPSHKRVVKQTQKNGLYDALDIGLIWLEQMNK